MKYYIDTEFLEGTQKEKFPISLFRKNTPPTIDLISIGIVSEDGREYYAISKDFNLKEAWNRHDVVIDIMSGDMRNKYPSGRKREVYWIRDSVLKPIWIELSAIEATLANIKNPNPSQVTKGMSARGMEIFNKAIYESGEMDDFFTFSNLKKLINKKGKTNEHISEDVKRFVFPTAQLSVEDWHKKYDNPLFYAYYADYDWVAFCWLFGKMMDLPKGFPMYCKDLKQEVDYHLYKDVSGTYDGNSLKNHPNYPRQENEHLAIEDARWNKRFHEYLKSF
ncbi:MAG: 3'-5' exoribonuclease [Flavobacterium sp.]|nr:3'-5' exoribonuclease [Flavobacterium sp.]